MQQRSSSTFCFVLRKLYMSIHWCMRFRWDAWIPYIHNQESWITKTSADACNDVFQGVKKVLYKKKFHSSSCCWASTFYSHSDVGLILIFTSGKVELRWCFFPVWTLYENIFWWYRTYEKTSFVKVTTPPILKIVFHWQVKKNISFIQKPTNMFLRIWTISVFFPGDIKNFSYSLF